MTKFLTGLIAATLIAAPAFAADPMEIRWSSTRIGDRYALVLEDQHRTNIGHYVIEITADSVDTIDMNGAARFCISPFDGSKPIIQVTAQGEGVLTFVMSRDPETGLFCPDADFARISVMAQ